MRKKKSLYNIIFTLLTYFVTMIFSFITQAIIVKLLGIEYSGINGLFTNILTMLSVAELGIGSAIIFKLYKPLANNDKEKIKSWMTFYKWCYRFVALFVFIVGLIIIPIVPTIVGKADITENIIVLYIISLLDVVLSYTMTYKRSLLYADQKNYIINIVHIGYIVLMNICQIIIIYLTRNYIYFLIIKLFYRLLENIIINTYVNKNYDFIGEKNQPLPQEEKKDIFERVKAIFLQKVSFVVNKGIDNILISMFLGVAAVGYYTNYNLVATTLSGIVYQIISAFLASVGNLLTEENKKKNYSIYKAINFMNSFITALCVSGYICCIHPFIVLWLGEKYTLSFQIVLSFGIYIYSDSIRRAMTIFKEAAGICKEDKYVYIIMSLINIALSYTLCRLIGISGVILGTSISYLFLIFYSYPKYIFINVFEEKSIEYYKEKVLFIIIIVISSLSSYYLCNLLVFPALTSFIFNGIISSLITSCVILIFYRNSEEYKYMKKLILKKVKRKRKNIKI